MLYLSIPAAGDPFLCAVVPTGTLILSVPFSVKFVNVGESDVATACPIDTCVPYTVTPVPAVSVVMLPDPSKLTPFIVLAVSKAVAVAAFPVVS